MFLGIPLIGLDYPKKKYKIIKYSMNTLYTKNHLFINNFTGIKKGNWCEKSIDVMKVS